MENTEKSAKLVSDIILAKTEKKIKASGKEYVIKPPTIHKLAGAAYYLSGLEGGKTFEDAVRQMQNLTAACTALSYFIEDDDKLTEELSEGSLTEIVNGLSVAMQMLSIKDFEEAVNFGEERRKDDSKSDTIGNDTLVGQIASFMENLRLSYHEVVYEFPYRTLLLMSKDKARVAIGDVYHETTDEEYFKNKGIKFNE